MKELNLSSSSIEVQFSPESSPTKNVTIEDIDLEIQAAERSEKDTNEPNQGRPTGSSFEKSKENEFDEKSEMNSDSNAYATCKKCERKYSKKSRNWKNQLKKHEESCGVAADITQPSELPTYDSLKEVSCKICRISSKSIQSVRSHYLSTHFGKKLNQEYGHIWETKPYNCHFEDCNLKTSKRANIQIHYLFKHGLYKKYLKEEIELKPNSPKQHDDISIDDMNETENDTDQYESRKCKHCGKKYSKKTDWKIKLSKHEESCQRSRKCKYCGKEYSKKTNSWKRKLSKHEESCQRIDTSPEGMFCKICNYSPKPNQNQTSFIKYHYLSKHFRPKLQEDYGTLREIQQPYICQFENCSYKNVKKACLEIHYLYNHNLHEKYLEDEIKLRKNNREEKNTSIDHLNETSNDIIQDVSMPRNSYDKSNKFPNEFDDSAAPISSTKISVENKSIKPKICKLCDQEFNGIDKAKELVKHLASKHFKQRIKDEIEERLRNDAPDCPSNTCSFQNSEIREILYHYISNHGILKKFIAEEMKKKDEISPEKNPEFTNDVQDSTNHFISSESEKISEEVEKPSKVQRSTKQNVNRSTKACELCHHEYTNQKNKCQERDNHLLYKHFKEKVDSEYGKQIENSLPKCPFKKCAYECPKTCPKTKTKSVLTLHYTRKHGILSKYLQEQIKSIEKDMPNVDKSSESTNNVTPSNAKTDDETMSSDMDESNFLLDFENSEITSTSKVHESGEETNKDTSVKKASEMSCALCDYKIMSSKFYFRKMYLNRHLYYKHFMETFDKEHGHKMPANPPYRCPFENCEFQCKSPKRGQLRLHYMTVHKIMENYYREEIKLRQETYGVISDKDIARVSRISESNEDIQKEATNIEDSPLASEIFDSNSEAQLIDSEKVTSHHEKACGLCSFVIFNKQTNRAFDRHLYQKHFKEKFHDEYEYKLFSSSSPPYSKHCPFVGCDYVNTNRNRKDVLREHYYITHKILDKYYNEELKIRQEKEISDASVPADKPSSSEIREESTNPDDTEARNYSPDLFLLEKNDSEKNALNSHQNKSLERPTKITELNAKNIKVELQKVIRDDPEKFVQENDDKRLNELSCELCPTVVSADKMHLWYVHLLSKHFEKKFYKEHKFPLNPPFSCQFEGCDLSTSNKIVFKKHYISAHGILDNYYDEAIKQREEIHIYENPYSLKLLVRSPLPIKDEPGNVNQNTTTALESASNNFTGTENVTSTSSEASIHQKKKPRPKCQQTARNSEISSMSDDECEPGEIRPDHLEENNMNVQEDLPKDDNNLEKLGSVKENKNSKDIRRPKPRPKCKQFVPPTSSIAITKRKLLFEDSPTESKRQKFDLSSMQQGSPLCSMENELMSSPFQLQDPNTGGIRLVDPSTIQEDRSRILPESLTQDDDDVQFVENVSVIKKENYEEKVLKAMITINNDDTFIVKIRKMARDINLKDLKDKMPHPDPDNYRYYIKTSEKCYEEFDDDFAILPLIDEKIEVKCRSI